MRDPLNESARVFLLNAGTVTKIEFYIEDIGSNPSGLAVNFRLAGNDLLAANATIIEGWNTFATLQNNTFVDNDEFDIAVRTSSGSRDVGNAIVIISTSL